MSVAGPVVPHHPPAWAWAMAAAAGGSDGDDDDPAQPWRRLKSAHEADLEPVRGPGRLTFACKRCRLAFASDESVKAHHCNRSDVFLTMHVDPRYYPYILVETFTLEQAAAVVRAARRARGP